MQQILDDMNYQRSVEAAAAAIANTRAGRRGAPPISNVLELLGSSEKLAHLRAQVLEDAEAALGAIEFQALVKALEDALYLIRVWRLGGVPIAPGVAEDRQAKLDGIVAVLGKLGAAVEPLEAPSAPKPQPQIVQPKKEERKS